MFKKIILFFTVIFLVILIWGFYEINSPKNKHSNEEIIFTISQGDNFKFIANKLKEKRIINNPILFSVYVLILGERKNLKAGTYLLSPSLNIIEITQKISSGYVHNRRVTIIEGWRISTIADHLVEEGIINRDIFMNLVNSPDLFKEKYPFLEGNSLEGYLFPDTYLIPYGTNEKDLIEIMLSNFDRQLTSEMRREISEKNKSIFEIVIMASLIEEEVREFKDMRLVSGVLWRRIEIGMPLQVDATIAYITGRRTTRISIAETRIESPYNTYINRGLPIGPISNPGINSIKAAINPEPSNYLFYLSKPTGETVFSRNLNEHNIAKNKYLR